MDISVLKRKLPLIVFIVSVFFLVGGYMIYKNEILAKIDNISPQTMKINLKNNDQIYSLSKHKNQENIFQLEVNITGKSSDYLTLYFGSKPDIFTKEVRLKKGKIDLTFIDDWYSDMAYVKVVSTSMTKGELELEYQFLGISKQ